MKAVFNNISIIYSVFEILKDIKIDINLKFTKNGIEIKDLSTDKTLAFEFIIEGKNLLEYKYDPKIDIIGLNTSYLCTILKLMEKDNTMEFILNNGFNNKLIIKSRNETNLKETEAELDLIDPEYFDANSITFDSGVYITMKTDDFYKTINYFKAFSDEVITFIYTSSLFTIKGSGQNINIKQDYSYRPDIQDDNVEIKILEDGKAMNVATYSIDNILKFKKCTKLGSPKIEIRISNNKLLHLSHDVGNIGKFKTIITPVKNQNAVETEKNNEEDNEEIEYNNELNEDEDEF